MRFLVAAVMAVTMTATAFAPSAHAQAVSTTVAGADSIEGILQASDYRATDGDILRLYQAFFKRLPDVAGTQYWIATARAGASLDSIAGYFAESEEFRLTYGSVTDDRFVEIVYGNVLGRAHDQAGFDYWLGLLRSRLTRGGVVRWIAANEEFIVRYPFSPQSPSPAGPSLPEPPAAPPIAIQPLVPAARPANPGNSVNCGDFATHADAQAWFDRYRPFYGDVANLDGDDDGIACEALP